MQEWERMDHLASRALQGMLANPKVDVTELPSDLRNSMVRGACILAEVLIRVGRPTKDTTHEVNRRNELAVTMLVGLLTNPNTTIPPENPVAIAAEAYSLADEMIQQNPRPDRPGWVVKPN